MVLYILFYFVEVSFGFRVIDCWFSFIFVVVVGNVFGEVVKFGGISVILSFCDFGFVFVFRVKEVKVIIFLRIVFKFSYFV